MGNGPTEHITWDEAGRPWVTSARVKVIELVRDRLAYGWSPEEMRFQHPRLSLAGIHAALSCYYDHQEALEAEIRRQAGEFDALYAQQGAPQPARQELEARLRREKRQPPRRVSLYLDAHVPMAVVRSLRLRVVDVLTAQEDDGWILSDSRLLDWTTSLGRVLFTQDEDTLEEVLRRQQAGLPFAGALFTPQGRLNIGQIVDELELAAVAGEPEEFANRLRLLPL